MGYKNDLTNIQDHNQAFPKLLNFFNFVEIGYIEEENIYKWEKYGVENKVTSLTDDNLSYLKDIIRF